MKAVYFLAPLLFILLPTRANAEGLDITVKVDPRKSNNKAWDSGGGAPDISLYTIHDGEKIRAPKKPCKNSYSCSFSGIKGDITRKGVWVSIWDSDMRYDDLIGKGYCKIGEKCRLGQATVRIEEKIEDSRPILLVFDNLEEALIGEWATTIYDDYEWGIVLDFQKGHHIKITFWFSESGRSDSNEGKYEIESVEGNRMTIRVTGEYIEGKFFIDFNDKNTFRSNISGEKEVFTFTREK